MFSNFVANEISVSQTKRYASDISTRKLASPSDVAVSDDNIESFGTSRLLNETRKVDIAYRDALGELRLNQPRVADRLEAATAEMPKVGEIFLGFKLLHELGHGAFGRVFLARQIALADRLVALKVAVDLHGETQRLAQLLHTNIMPIYSEHRSGNLYAACMPYFGSSTLADLYKSLHSTNSFPTSGKQLLTTLYNRQSTVPGTDPSVQANPGVDSLNSEKSQKSAPVISPFASLPANLSNIEQMSYVDAVLWIAARLADGLAHAHERGIIHRDLKPANILLCDDGQPMLLDFNLAEDVKLRSSISVAQIGGTLPYMSPEQLIAYRDNTGQIDGRSDVYSLGLIMYHLLTGVSPFPVRRGRSQVILPRMIADRQVTPPLLSVHNSTISPAVESIVRHCLEPNPELRYGSARQLAEDLERQRANLPLLHAPEPSLIERVVKWSRRHPKLASPPAISAAIAAILLVIVTIGVQLSLRSKARELEINRQEALASFHDFHTGYLLAQNLLTTDDVVQIHQGIKQGEKALSAYNVLEQADWLEQPKVKELSPDDRARLKAEVGEIAFLLARVAHFQPVKNERALTFNDIAGTYLDVNARLALLQQRADLTEKMMQTGEYQRLREKLEQVGQFNGQGKFLLACEHTAQGRYREALRHLDAVVIQMPDDFGSWSLKARCHQMLDETAEAFAAYGTAIALRPNFAQSYIERANMNYATRLNLDQSKADLDQALRLQPNSLEAHLSRGLVHFALGNNNEALEDIDWALGHENVPSRVWFIRARIKAKLGDFEGATKDREIGFQSEPTDPISWVSRGMARLKDDPKGALSDFIKAEEMYPRFHEALTNQAYVYSEILQQPQDALAAVERILKNYPDNSRAMTHRAVLLARLGKFDESISEARKSLRMNSNAENLYRVSCVLSLASVKNPALRKESMQLLALAIAQHYGHEKMETDSDLDPLRKLPEFKEFVGYIRIMKLLSKPSATENE